MPKQKKRFEYKVNLGKDMNGRLIRKSFYSVKSLADARRKQKNTSSNMKWRCVLLAMVALKL